MRSSDSLCRRLALSAAPLLLCAGPLLSGCAQETLAQESSSIESDLTGTRAGQGLMGMISLIQSAPDTVAFQGVRRVELASEDPVVIYREVVAGDGQGGFQIEPLNVLTPHPDPTGFMNQQRQMKGFQHRYGGFRIQDALLFQLSYQISILSRAEEVAGIQCTRLHVQKSRPGNRLSINAPNQFLVDFDPQTGLVLAYEELDAFGTKISRSSYESISYGQPTAAMHVPAYQEAPISIKEDLSTEAGFEVLRPTYLPAKFRLLRASMVIDGNARWIRQVFSDGLETLLLMHKQQDPNPSPSGSTVGALVNGNRTVLMGVVNGCELIAEGKLDPDGLKEFIASCW